MKNAVTIFGILVILFIFWLAFHKTKEVIPPPPPPPPCDQRCKNEQYMKDHPVDVVPCPPEAVGTSNCA